VTDWSLESKRPRRYSVSRSAVASALEGWAGASTPPSEGVAGAAAVEEQASAESASVSSEMAGGLVAEKGATQVRSPGSHCHRPRANDAPQPAAHTVRWQGS